MPTPHKPSHFLLQTLAIIAIISLSIPTTSFAYFGSGSNGANAGNNGYSQSSYKSAGGSGGATGGISKDNSKGLGGGVNVNRQSGASRSGSGYGTSKPASSGGGGTSKSGTRSSPGAAGDPTNNNNGSIKGSSGSGGSGGGGNDSNGRNGGDGSRGGNIMSRVAQVVSATTKAAVNMSVGGMRAVVDAAKKAAGIDTVRFAGLPSLNQPAQPKAPTTKTDQLTGETRPISVPNNIRSLVDRQKAGTMTPEQEKAYEQMNLEEAKRGFQKELNERAKGIYTPMDDAKRAADKAKVNSVNAELSNMLPDVPVNEKAQSQAGIAPAVIVPSVGLTTQIVEYFFPPEPVAPTVAPEAQTEPIVIPKADITILPEKNITVIGPEAFTPPSTKIELNLNDYDIPSNPKYANKVEPIAQDDNSVLEVTRDQNGKAIKAELVTPGQPPEADTNPGKLVSRSLEKPKEPANVGGIFGNIKDTYDPEQNLTNIVAGDTDTPKTLNGPSVKNQQIKNLEKNLPGAPPQYADTKKIEKTVAEKIADLPGMKSVVPKLVSLAKAVFNGKGDLEQEPPTKYRVTEKTRSLSDDPDQDGLENSNDPVETEQDPQIVTKESESPPTPGSGDLQKQEAKKISELTQQLKIAEEKGQAIATDIRKSLADAREKYKADYNSTLPTNWTPADQEERARSVFVSPTTAGIKKDEKNAGKIIQKLVTLPNSKEIIGTSLTTYDKEGNPEQIILTTKNNPAGDSLLKQMRERAKMQDDKKTEDEKTLPYSAATSEQIENHQKFRDLENTIPILSDEQYKRALGNTGKVKDWNDKGLLDQKIAFDAGLLGLALNGATLSEVKKVSPEQMEEHAKKHGYINPETETGVTVNDSSVKKNQQKYEPGSFAKLVDKVAPDIAKGDTEHKQKLLTAYLRNTERYNPKQAVGIVARGTVESAGLNPLVDAYGTEPSSGLFQWQGERKKGLESFAKEKFSDLTEVTNSKGKKIAEVYTDGPGFLTQAAYIDAEVSGKSKVKDYGAKKFGEWMKKNPDASAPDVAEKFTELVERPAGNPNSKSKNSKTIAQYNNAIEETRKIAESMTKNLGVANKVANSPKPLTDTFEPSQFTDTPQESDKPSETKVRPDGTTIKVTFKDGKADKVFVTYPNETLRDKFYKEADLTDTESNTDDENSASETDQEKRPEPKNVTEEFEKATTIEETDSDGVKFGKTVLKTGMPKTLLVAGDAAVGFFGLIGQLFGVDLSLSPGTGKPPLSDEDRALGSGGSSGRINDVNQDTERTLDASQFTAAQNTKTLVNNVLTLNSSRVTSFIPSPDSAEAKAGLIRRITTTIDKTTYVVELRSRLTLSEKFIVVNATPNVAGAKVTFSYTDNGPDGSLDAFSANGVNLTGSAISKEVRNKFEEELRTLTNLYYKSL
jgi:hypothetical protein